MDDWNPLSQILFVATLWYGTYGLFSLVIACIFKTFWVAPILMYCGIRKPKVVWKHSLMWGFWISWQYGIAIILLACYSLAFGLIRKISGCDLKVSSFWNAKEKKFFHSTPKTLLNDWMRTHFAQYYWEWKLHG